MAMQTKERRAFAGLQAIYDDPSTPYWAKRIIEARAESDPTDTAAALEVLARAWAEYAAALAE